jgi:hypothetical protein
MRQKPLQLTLFVYRYVVLAVMVLWTAAYLGIAPYDPGGGGAVRHGSVRELLARPLTLSAIAGRWGYRRPRPTLALMSPPSTVPVRGVRLVGPGLQVCTAATETRGGGGDLGFGVILGALAFSQLPHHSVPGLVQPIARKQTLTAVLFWGLTSTFFIYAAVGCMLSVYFGSQVRFPSASAVSFAHWRATWRACRRLSWPRSTGARLGPSAHAAMGAPRAFLSCTHTRGLHQCGLCVVAVPDQLLDRAAARLSHRVVVPAARCGAASAPPPCRHRRLTPRGPQ